MPRTGGDAAITTAAKTSVPRAVLAAILVAAFSSVVAASFAASDKCDNAAACYSQALARLRAEIVGQPDTEKAIAAAKVRYNELQRDNDALKARIAALGEGSKRLGEVMTALLSGFGNVEMLPQIYDAELDAAHLNDPRFMIVWGDCPPGYLPTSVAAHHGDIFALPHQGIFLNFLNSQGIVLTGIKVKCGRFSTPHASAPAGK